MTHGCLGESRAGAAKAGMPAPAVSSLRSSTAYTGRKKIRALVD